MWSRRVAARPARPSTPALNARVLDADRDRHVGDPEHHFALMLEYERKTRALQQAIERYTEGLRIKFRWMYPERDETSINVNAFADPTRKSLIEDQQWYERMAIREATIYDTIINRRRYQIEYGELPPRISTRLEEQRPHAA